MTRVIFKDIHTKKRYFTTNLETATHAKFLILLCLWRPTEMLWLYSLIYPQS